MAFCPNKNLPEWEALKKVTKFPYTVWTENEGNVDKFLRDFYEPINDQKATAWLNKTFPDHAVEFYDLAKNIGNRTVHGYVANGVFNMWRKAEVGTEFHEGYHLAFRTMLSNSTRELLYKDAEKQFGKHRFLAWRWCVRRRRDSPPPLADQGPRLREHARRLLVLYDRGDAKV